jgi:hypothetical protein
VTAATADVLAGLPRPLGSPAGATGAARTIGVASQELGSQAKSLVGGMQAITTSVWTGKAAQSAMGYAAVLAAVCAKAADAAEQASIAVGTYGRTLEAAQTEWDHAARIAEQAVADEAAYRTQLNNQAQSLVTKAMGHPDESLGAAHAAAAIRSDASGYQSPLRARAVALATNAIRTAQQANAAAARQVQSATTSVAPPKPPAPKPHHTPWYESAWHQVEGFGDGLYHGVKDPLGFVAGLVNPFGDPVKNWEQLGNGLAAGFEHPGQFAKALADWKDLSSGNYGRWLGQLAPTIAATVFTGGAAAGVKGTDALAGADRLAAGADAASSSRFIAGADGITDTGISIPHGQPVIIGEDMTKRVTPAAQAMGLEDYAPPTLTKPLAQMAHNRYWVNEMMNQGRGIVDVGPAPGRALYPLPTSDFYKMELQEIQSRHYPWLLKVNIDHP